MYSASIPDVVYLEKYIKQKKSYKRYNINNWIHLPIKNKFQSDFIFTDKDFEKKLYKVYDKINTNKNKNNYVKFINNPFELKLVGFEDNSMKVVTKDGRYCFTLGNDVLINSIFTNGIDKDGNMFGKYIFSKFNNTITPIQIGSGIHKAVLEFLQNKLNSIIPIKKLNVGQVYANKFGETALLVGFINTKTMKVSIPKGTEKYYFAIKGQGQPNEPNVKFSISYKNEELLTLWMGISNKNYCNLSINDIKNEFKKAISNSQYYKFFTKKNHNYNNLLFEEKIDIPNNIIIHIKNITEKSISNSIVSFREFRTNNIHKVLKNSNNKNPPDIIRHYDAIWVASHAKLLNMVPYGVVPYKSDILNVFDQWEK